MEDSEILTNPDLIKPGSGISYHQFERPSPHILQTFEYEEDPLLGCPSIKFKTNEVTSLCPLTGQPDFYSVEICYTPTVLCIESKSAKLYLGAYRSEKAFIEVLAGKILRDWVDVCLPLSASISISMRPRGGIEITVSQCYPASENCHD